MKIHYAKFVGGVYFTACGWSSPFYKKVTTRIRKRVTCKNCLRTIESKRKK